MRSLTFMDEHHCDVAVIGGGVAGLAAAGELGRKGYRVLIMEARDRLGGRVHTVRRAGWSSPVELGAQFVHGGNDALWALLKRHQVKTARIPESHWHRQGATLREIDASRRIANVTRQIDEKRMRGWSFGRFLKDKRTEVDALDRELAVGFVEGFEGAPCTEMSAASVAGETFAEDDQFILSEGYATVVSALESELDDDLVRVVLDAPCTSVHWSKGKIELRSPRLRISAAAAVVAVPLGVLQAKHSTRGVIAFAPGLGEHQRTVDRMRMGHVLRLNLRFDRRCWRKLRPEPLRCDGGFGFIHSVEQVPVWWSLTEDAVLTGWCGGPGAMTLSGESESRIVNIAIESLRNLWNVPASDLLSAVLDVATHNWMRDPFSRGAYSFTRAGQESAAAALRQPIQGTLFFAGEATADGEEVGTVHGALASGLRAAAEVTKTGRRA